MTIVDSFAGKGVDHALKGIDVCYQAMGNWTDVACKDLGRGNATTAALKASANSINLPRDIFGIRPDVTLRQVENNFLMDEQSELGVPKVEEVRFMGSGPFELAMHMQSSIVLPAYNESNLRRQLTMLEGSFPILTFLKTNPDINTDPFRGVIQTCCSSEPIIKADTYHFSDPRYDPSVNGAHPNEDIQRMQFEAMRKILPNLGDFSLDALKKAFRLKVATAIPEAFSSYPQLIHWGKLCELDDIPQKGVICTNDSVQSLNALNKPVDMVVLDHVDPNIFLNETDQSLPLLNNPDLFLELLTSFTNNVLSQIKPNGELILTVGQGNSRIELTNRLVLVTTLSKLLEEMGILQTLTYKQNIPLLKNISTIQGTPEEEYLNKVISHGLLRARFTNTNDIGATPQERMNALLSNTNTKKLLSKTTGGVTKKVNVLWPKPTNQRR